MIAQVQLKSTPHLFFVPDLFPIAKLDFPSPSLSLQNAFCPEIPICSESALAPYFFGLYAGLYSISRRGESSKLLKVKSLEQKAICCISTSMISKQSFGLTLTTRVELSALFAFL
jgi:hypothetical protein